ncbi:MAG: hypothetical protein Q9162_005726 [Coniocarpon cinnabarinum]
MPKPTGDLELHDEQPTDRKHLRLKNDRFLKYMHDKPELHPRGYFAMGPLSGHLGVQLKPGEDVAPERHWTLWQRMRQLNPAHARVTHPNLTKELEILCERLHDLYYDGGELEDRKEAATALDRLYRTHPYDKVIPADVLRAAQMMYKEDELFVHDVVHWLLYADGKYAEEHNGTCAVDWPADQEKRNVPPKTPETSSDEGSR